MDFPLPAGSDQHFGQSAQQQRQQQQQQQQQQQHWPPQLLTPSHAPQPFPSPPASSISEHGQYHSPFYAPPGSQQQTQQSNTAGPNPGDHSHTIPRATSSLSLNISSLTVTSPTNLSPITAPSSALSPATPISPNPFTSHHQQHHLPTSQFPPFSSPEKQPPNTSQNPSQPAGAYDSEGRITSATSRSSSSTSSASLSLSRKRSFTSTAPSSTIDESSAYDDSRGDTPMELSFDEPSGSYNGHGSSSTPGPGTGGGGSPVEAGSGSGEEGGSGSALGGLGSGSMERLNLGIGSGIMGKPVTTNNFVTKLYHMINDPKSAHFIAWTELGTSFVVSNVGEFSRSILGSHFKHNNFSSFVRQLNMYGFHKINRTPRAQRTSTDAQTWEFSHHKFLRGRPDLLEEIKRKALEPDPAIKHRVELPGEVASQLGAMREDNRRMREQLNAERRKVDKLIGLVGTLWDMVGKGFLGNLPPFPPDLLEGVDSPNIYVTSPSSSTARYPPQLPLGGLASQSMHSLHTIGSSPNASPTTAEFPQHQIHHPHQHAQHHATRSLSRQHSYQNLSGGWRHDSSPIPASPAGELGGMDFSGFGGDDDGDGSSASTGGRKRQRMSNDELNGSDVSVPAPPDMIPSPVVVNPPQQQGGKKASRARSDSAPLGYSMQGLWPNPGGIGRPRSGSGMAPLPGPTHHHHLQQQRSLPVPNISSATRGAGGGAGGQPLLSITVPGNAPPPNR